MRQIISTELSRELMRRQHGGADGASPSSVGFGAVTPKKTPPPKAPVPKPVPEVAQAVSRDMFGRPITKKKGGALGKRSAGVMSSPAIVQAPYRFKYHEGVTDAVRRTVRVRDLM